MGILLRKWLIMVIVIIFTAGCGHDAQLVSKDELINMTHIVKEPKLAIWYYQGSDDTYHYFKHIDKGVNEEFRVLKSEIVIENEYSLRRNQRDWRVMRWGEHAIYY